MLTRLAELFGLSGEGQTSGGRERAAARVTEACHRLLSERGEVSGARLASEILTSYENLDAAGRQSFFDLLLKEFSPDPVEVGQAGDAYRDDPSVETLARLQRAVESPRQELFRRLNMAPGGTRGLVRLQADLMKAGGHVPITTDLGHLLTSWFNPGFLTLKRIDWHTSATILEKLIQYEAVHQIKGWEDLRRRLEADRRCYAFFHPALPDEPIIFVEVALTRGMSDKVQPLLDLSSSVVPPESADCAVFYSITNCQPGLRGVPFGSFLLKQVVEDLEREFHRIRRFATLSPVPGFRSWLSENAAEPAGAVKFTNIADIVAKLDEPGWHENERLAAKLREGLVPLCAYYLLRAKRDKEPVDSVARFHLRNGARLERINWRGDTSKAGLERSAGIMVNYVYEVGNLERNHERYIWESRVAAASGIETLARQAITPLTKTR